MNKKVEVSVIMSVYDEDKRILKESIYSILNQTFQDFEFIIVHDNPKDKEIESYLKELSSMDDRIKLVKNEKNLGLTESLNLALSLVQGKYIARMDADDVSLPDRLKIQYEFMEKHSEIDLIGSWAYIIDISGEVKNTIRTPVKYSIIKKVLKYRNPLLHPTWFGRYKIFHDLEGYKGFLKVSQDYEFLVRAVFRGYIIINIPEILLKYRLRPDRSGFRHPFYKVITEELIHENYVSLEKHGVDILTYDLYTEHTQRKFSQKDRIDQTRKYILEFLSGRSLYFFKAFFTYPSLTFNFLYKAMASKILETYEYVARDKYDIPKR